VDAIRLTPAHPPKAGTLARFQKADLQMTEVGGNRSLRSGCEMARKAVVT
jgi:hypothetical protein